MAASCPLPVTPDLPTLRAKLQGLLQFLRDALSISNAHTVDFYTESVWEELVDLTPETVLAALRKSASEAEARPSETRRLVEAEGEAGGWGSRRGGAGREAEEKVLAGEASPLVEARRTRRDRGRGRGGPLGGVGFVEGWGGGVLWNHQDHSFFGCLYISTI